MGEDVLVKENAYEIIGNQIKFYLTEDRAKGWNQIPHPQFRNAEEIGKWCESSANEMVCHWDALNQNAMSVSDTTDFLHRWMNWYVKEPLDSTALEIRKLPDELVTIITNVPFDAFELLKRTAHMVLECIYFAFGFFL